MEFVIKIANRSHSTIVSIQTDLLGVPTGARQNSNLVVTTPVRWTQTHMDLVPGMKLSITLIQGLMGEPSFLYLHSHSCPVL